MLRDTCSQGVSGLKLCPEPCRIQLAEALHCSAAGKASSPVFVSDWEQQSMQQAFLWLLFTPLGKAALLWGTMGTLPKQSPPAEHWFAACPITWGAPLSHTGCVNGKWRKLHLSMYLSFLWGGNINILLMWWQC